MEILNQDKKKIITIAGRPGSGKSTTSKAVAKLLGYEHFSSGDLFRAIGRERGLDVYDTNLAAEQEQLIDQLVDQKLQEIGTTQGKVVIDSRLAWHWIPASFKVFLDLDLEVAAKRIIANTDAARLRHEHVPGDPKEYADILQKRLDSEARRYKNLYDANPYDKSNYDLVVDAGVNNANRVAEMIIEEFRRWFKS
jgi:cytidylate kinase